MSRQEIRAGRKAERNAAICVDAAQMTDAEMAVKYGISHQRVCEIRRAGGVKAKPAWPYAGRHADLVEDVEFMLATREYPGRICERIGIDPITLAKRLRRNGRGDLAPVFETVAASA